MIVPVIRPAPVRLPVSVTELAPVMISPEVMVRLTALILLFKVISLLFVLLTERSLKVVAPVSCESLLPLSVMVEVLAVKVPLLVQSPPMVCEYAPASNVVLPPSVKSPLMVSALEGVLVFPPESVRL